MTLPDLATLWRLHAEATKADWLYENGEIVQPVFGPPDKCGRVRRRLTVNVVAVEQDRCECETTCYCCGRLNMLTKDAELIVAMRNNLDELLHAASQWAQVQGMRDEIEALRDSVNQDHWKRVLLNKLLALIDAPPKE